MNFNDFLKWEDQSRDTIDVKRVYIDIAGDLIAGILLSQIIYWNLPTKEGSSKLKVIKNNELWLAKGREAWWEECRITATQFDRAIKILEQKNLVQKERFRYEGSPTIHIKLNSEQLMKALFDQTEKKEQKKADKADDSTFFMKGENGISHTGDADKADDSTFFMKHENPISRNMKMELHERGKTLTENTTENIKTTTTPEEKKSEKKEYADAVVVVDTYAINELILKYLKPSPPLTAAHLKKIGQAKGFTFERFEKILQVAKVSNIRSLVGWLIKAIENPDFDFTTVETKAVADSAAPKSKIVNYKGREWDYKRLAELTQEHLEESVKDFDLKGD